MPRTKISEFSATPGNNTDIDGINLAEGCAPSGINDAIRELMAQLKDFQAGTAGDSFNGPIGATTPAAGTFTNFSASGTFALTGDQVQISEGGTGQTTANAAFNALAPSQSTHAGKYLKTDGTNTSWDALDISTADITGTLPIANGGTGLTALGTGVQTALGIAVGSSGAFVTNGGALGTPSSGTVTNLTGTASININGTVGATTPTTGAFTTLSASGNITVSGGTANGVAYLNGSKVLTTGSALSFDGTNSYLGIGPGVTPTKSLTIYNPSIDTEIRLQTGTKNFYLSQRNSSGQVDYIVADNAAQTWSVNNTEGMRLTSTGLGIGTSSPAYKLDVTGGLITANLRYGTVGAGNTALMRFSVNNNYDGQSLAAIGALSENANTTATALVMQTEAAGGAGLVERARIDSSGNLGLGVTPSAWRSTTRALQIGSTSSFQNFDNGGTIAVSMGNNFYWNSSDQAIYIQSKAASNYYQTGGQHVWGAAASGTAGTNFTFTQAMTLDCGTAIDRTNLLVGTTTAVNAAANRGNIVVNGSSTAILNLAVGSAAAGYLFHDGTNLLLTQVLNNSLLFSTNNTERARITSGGYFKASDNGTYLGGSSHELRNTSNGSYSTRVIHAGATDAYGLNVYFSGYSPNGTANWFLLCEDTTATRAEIRSNGGLANYSGNNVNLSDRREKTNFAPAKSYLDTICAIPVQTFNYIDQSEDDPGLTLGVVAQDVQAVAPELVMESNWGTAEDPKMRLSIYQTDLQYALMKCIQELKAQNDDLRARVAQLEAK